MINFEGQTVIVTGGGRGIGHGITTSFAKAGAEVVICGRNAPEDFDNDIAKQIHFLELDVRALEAPDELIRFAQKQSGTLTTLINNAGGGPEVASAEASPNLTQKVIQLNLTAPLLMSQSFYNSLHQQETVGGSIVNISSVTATRSAPRTVAYGAAKAGLLNVTTSLAMEWAPYMRVNAIITGLIKTKASHDHYGGEAGMAHLANSLPMKRMGTPDDMAHACLFLADSKSEYISGACLEVHGGGEPPSFLKIVQEAIEKAE